jgi:NAD+ kinase
MAKMRVVIYGKKFGHEADQMINLLYKELDERNIESITYGKFAEFIKSRAIPDFDSPIYSKPKELTGNIDFLISIGGDGTILDTISSIGDSNIPIVGINTGRLGFLANNAKEEVSNVLDNLSNGYYRMEERSLLSVQTEENVFSDYNFALNEVTIHKKDTSSMLTLHTYVNGEFLNSYWADGLIISTPTGSTAYSLSCGGPILAPDSTSFIINPIAPHNLTARPIIVPDNAEIKVRVEGREDEFLVTLDSHSKSLNDQTEIILKKCDFKIKLIQFPNQNFFKTIRQKLLWGQDKRN